MVICSITIVLAVVVYNISSSSMVAVVSSSNSGISYRSGSSCKSGCSCRSGSRSGSSGSKSIVVK